MIAADSLVNFLVGCFYLEHVLLVIFFFCCKSLNSSLQLKARSFFLNLTVFFFKCRNRIECPDRHQINLSIDMAQNIADEMIETPECVTVS